MQDLDVEDLKAQILDVEKLANCETIAVCDIEAENDNSKRAQHKKLFQTKLSTLK